MKHVLSLVVVLNKWNFIFIVPRNKGNSIVQGLFNSHTNIQSQIPWTEMLGLMVSYFTKIAYDLL